MGRKFKNYWRNLLNLIKWGRNQPISAKNDTKLGIRSTHQSYFCMTLKKNQISCSQFHRKSILPQDKFLSDVNFKSFREAQKFHPIKNFHELSFSKDVTQYHDPTNRKWKKYLICCFANICNSRRGKFCISSVCSDCFFCTYIWNNDGKNEIKNWRKGNYCVIKYLFKKTQQRISGVTLTSHTRKIKNFSVFLWKSLTFFAEIFRLLFTAHFLFRHFFSFNCVAMKIWMIC